MKIHIFFVAALCLFGVCFAQRGRRMGTAFSMGPMGGRHRMMMSQMMANPFEMPKSETDQMLNTCLSPLTQAVDVVIDVKPWRVEPSDDPFETMLWSFGPWRHTPMDRYDIADFVDSLSENIPKQSLYAILVDGEPENQARYYMNAPVPPVPATTKTTPAPVTGYREETLNNGVNMVRWWYHHSIPPQEEPLLPSVRTLLTKALFARSLNQPIDSPKSKDSNAPSTIFTVVITDSGQKTPLSSLIREADNTLILDIGGKLASAQRNYLDRNLLVVPDYASLKKFSQAVQFIICQATGGNRGQLASKPRMTVKTETESSREWNPEFNPVF